MSKLIPQNFIDDLIAAVDITSIIQSRINLKKQGSNLVAVCPFHDEKTPSFNVIPAKNFYYCFGCGASGNAIRFLMAFDRMEFVDAVKQLAAEAGFSIPVEDQQQNTTDDEDRRLLKKIDQYYQSCLKTSEKAIAYLKSRGLTGIIAKQFHLGFAPDTWDSTIKLAGKNPPDLESLKRNGLVIQKDNGRCYDRFRDRIMFPIRNTAGHTIAFGGRTLGDATPKYMNSPETPLFHKSNELYGLYEVLQKSRSPASILLTEGYMDVIALHQHGIQNAVATLGTATNTRHLQKLFRYTREVIFCFDGDNAGQTAAWRALTMSLPAMREGIQLRFMFLPASDDPDTLVRRLGKQGFMQRIKNAEPLSMVFFNLLKKEIPLNTPDARATFAGKAMEHLNRIPKGLFKELMLAELAKQIHVYVSDLDSTSDYKTSKRQYSKRQSTLLNPVHKAIALLLQEPRLHQQPINLTHLQASSLPDIPLLVDVIKRLKESPQISVGELIEHINDESAKQTVAMLAAHRFPFATEGILLEFNAALAALLTQQHELETEQLIEKSRRHGLSPEEKKRLCQLLTDKHNDRV